jgi:hypothetical protein
VQISPVRPKLKAVKRRTRNTAYHTLMPMFATEGGYMTQVTKLGLTIKPEWRLKRLPFPENIKLSEFVKHAAACGLMETMATSIREFAKQWLADEKDVKMTDGTTEAST